MSKQTKQKQFLNVRLPSQVKPERYKLTIKPDLKLFTFLGQETIFLELLEQCSEIKLHAKDLNISEVVYTNEVGVYPASKITFDQKNETVTFRFKNNLKSGKGELSLLFNGVLNDKLRGFYRSRYLVNGHEKFMATTQFEATDARKAFPCVDEPAVKAIFDVTLSVPKNLTVISNTIETSVTEHEGDIKVVTFAPTPKMSTYLLAFIVGDFEYIEGYAKLLPKAKKENSNAAQNLKGTLVRIFVTPGKKHQAEFALGCAIKCLEFYNEYFDIPYPLPVLDLIAIPDFASGAMENWGAITYRETALLVDPEQSSASNKQWVALVIAHELAHQWFGNLVTMEWWTHLWLNEGFASYIEYLAVNELFPEWDIWTQFAYADLGVALKLDGLKSTHPIEIEVHHPDEIGEIFDEVSYSKGGSVIRMLAEYLGEKDFRDGLRFYLKKHSYGNAFTEDLWKAFEKVSGKKVKSIMNNWTSLPGYPKLTVSEEKSGLKIKQSRFFSSGISDEENKIKQQWIVPVSFKTEKTLKKNTFLLGKKEMTLVKPKGDWVKFNIGETSFFRTQYSSSLLNKFHEPITTKALGAIDRLGIIRDCFALSEAGQLPTHETLKIVESYINETDYTVWVEIAAGLGSLSHLLFRESYYENYQEFCKQIFSKISKQIGWERKKTDSHTDTLLRNLALYQAGKNGDSEKIEKAKKIFNEQKKVSADLRGVVYRLVAENSGPKEYNIFLKSYENESLQEEKNRLMHALGSFKQQKLLKKALEFSISKKVRFQDTPSVIGSVFSNNYGRQIAWEFIKENWELLLERYGDGSHTLGRLLKSASLFSTEKEALDFERFLKKHKAPGATRTISQVLERIHSNVFWLKKDSKEIDEFLSLGKF